MIVVKLADRLHNMQTLEHLPPETRRRISRETLEIYAPIAHRLGMARVQGRPRGPRLLPSLPAPVRRAALEDRGEDEARPRRHRAHAPTAWRRRSRPPASRPRSASGSSATTRSTRKLRRQGIDISQLYDYLAFRIVTPNLRDTYAALGVVHQSWRPIPGRFKDYIAMPKPNLYQSLHTTVVGDTGPAVRGADPHPRDGPGRRGGDRRPLALQGGQGRGPESTDRNILWLRQLLEWQKEVQDPRTFLTTLKVDLYPDEVYVFTPKGEVLRLPARRHAARLRLPGAHRPRPPLRRRAGQRPAGAAAHAAPERRHGGDPHQRQPRPEPRLAQPGRHLAGQEQDPAVAQHAAEAPRHGDRPPHAREGGARATG